MSLWSQHRGRCAERVRHFLCHYVDLGAASRATISAAHVRLGGDTLATFTWETGFGRGDVPVFEFFGERREDYERAQVEKRDLAIYDGCALASPDAARRMPVDFDALDVLAPGARREAWIFNRLARQDEPSFFTADGRVYFETPGRLYRWDPECWWLLWVAGSRSGLAGIEADARFEVVSTKTVKARPIA